MSEEPELSNTAPVENSNRDIILASHSIDRNLHYKLTNLLDRKESGLRRCTLFLTTLGGDPHAGYRIARCLRHYYEHVRLVVPSYCKSAGTLIAICADELAIGDLGELGPLDIQVSKPSEIQEQGSGLDIIQALEMTYQHGFEVFKKTLLDIRLGAGLSTRMAGEFATKMAIGSMSALYSQIDPNKLGEMQRAISITYEYGIRLNCYSQNLNEDSLNRLVASYPSHSFVIDRKEAKEIFKKVSLLTQEDLCICNEYWDFLYHQTNNDPIILENH